VHFLVDPTPFGRETMRLLGINEPRQAVFFDPRATYTARHLLVASGTPCGDPPRPQLQLLRSTMYRALFPRGERMPQAALQGDGNLGSGSGGGDTPARRAARLHHTVVIAQRQSTRRIANLDALLHVLDAFLRKGQQVRVFEMADGGGTPGGGGGGGRGGGAREGARTTTEEEREVGAGGQQGGGAVGGVRHRALQGHTAKRMSFIEQYSLFRHASLVVGSHGAALANLVWAQEGTKVIEFVPVLEDAAFYARLCYASVAGALQHPYYAVGVNTSSYDEPTLTIPVEAFKQALHAVGT
jgi:hypothetical protein